MRTVAASPASLDDESLVARAAAGEAPALEELVGRYQERVFRLATRLTGDESDAADVLQDTFLSVCRNLAAFRGEASFSTWLYRVATNAALMHRRARSRRPAESLDAFLPRFEESGRHAATPEQLRTVCRIEERIDRRRLADRAREGLDRLPDIYRAAFVLRDLEDLSTAEVGRILGLEPAAVRQRVHRARLMLRGYLNDLAGRTT
jgi:RNA polymerase sigma-70 factor (ECF subfamily)